VVPREKVAAVGAINNIGTPPMNCYVRGTFTSNIFSAVHVAFGRVIPMGTSSRPWVRFEEDHDGWKGSSPLVASFIMPSAVLTLLEPPQNLFVSLAFRSTPASTTQLFPLLGPSLSIYEAPLMDIAHVHILPEPTLPSANSGSIPMVDTPGRQVLTDIGKCDLPLVEFDDDCALIKTFTARISVEDQASKTLFQSGASPQIVQISPCIMRLTLGKQMQDAAFPFPVVGSQNKLRLARKSLYIEVRKIGALRFE